MHNCNHWLETPHPYRAVSNTEKFTQNEKLNKGTASGEAVGLSTISKYMSYPKERGMRGDGHSRQNHRANS